MADNNPIRIGRTNNIESSNPGTGTVLARASSSPRTDPVFTVRNPVGGDGIHGEASATNTGVAGSSSDGFGVSGSSTGGDGVSGSSIRNVGVRGFSTSNAGVSGASIRNVGVRGSSSIAGVFGESASGVGVDGLSTSGVGVRGASTSGDGVDGLSTSGDGVRGTSTSGNGVDGVSTSGVGVRGVSTSGDGVDGVSNSGVGVRGVTTSGNGVIGFSTSNVGVFAVSVTGAGLLGASTTGFNDGVLGVADSGPGVRGVSTNGPGVVGNSGSNFGGDFFGPPSTNGSSGGLRVDGNIVKFNGEYSEALPHPDGSKRLLYGLLSPESWYEDFGRGDLVEGRGRVALDPDFAAILGIDDGDYHVFLTPEGDSNGLYVSSRNPAAFEVQEQRGGTSSLTFSYRVVAVNKRKDAQPERLAKVAEPERIDFAPPTEEVLRQMMRQVPPPHQSPQPSMMPPIADLVRREEEHRGRIDELRRQVEEQRRKMEELRRRVGPQEEAPPETT